MIVADRPSIFKDANIVCGVSSLSDGTMSQGGDSSVPMGPIVMNRKVFLAQLDASIERTCLVRISYGRSDFSRLAEVDELAAGKGMADANGIAIADGLFTKAQGLALFLPLADCAGVVLHDPDRGVLGVLHLGRHAAYDGLAAKAISYMREHYGTQPSSVKIWISPSVAGDSYDQEYFPLQSDPAWRSYATRRGDAWYVDLQGFNVAAFVAAGVLPRHIERSSVDTAIDPNYPSHHRFKKYGEPTKAGRFAVAAYMR